MITPEYEEIYESSLHDFAFYALYFSKLKLRSYQQSIATAIIEALSMEDGRSLVVILPRQSGKNELQAQLEAWLLNTYRTDDVEMVKVSPTWKPQSLKAMRRLERVLGRNEAIKGFWHKESGYVFRLEKARIFFLSGSPKSSIVGATANLLLQCDEAQDVSIEKWDKEIAPMAASTNAVQVFWGTAWTSKTLLARELAIARAAERRDGRRRVFVLTADDVRRQVPAYGKFVDNQVKKLGRNHPFIRTQYFSEEIDDEGALFDARRLSLMRGTHPPMEMPFHSVQCKPQRGIETHQWGVSTGMYAFTLDVAGADEASGEGALRMTSPRDATALTIFEIDPSSLADELVGAPTYRVANRVQWTNTAHTKIYGYLRALVEQWEPRYLVIDATGVGAGLADFLSRAYPRIVIPFVFSVKSKSDLGWDFLALVETGRYKEYRASKKQATGRLAELQRVFFQQAEHCQQKVGEGPGKTLQWGVPEGTRDQATGELVHDDLLISAALCSVLDKQEWGSAVSEVLPAIDPLEGLRDVY